MGAIETKTFRTEDGVAVPLPEMLGIAPGTPVTVEEVDGVIRITPVVDQASAAAVAKEGKAKLSEMIAKLRAIGPITPVGKREPIEWPDRPGLY